MTRYSIDADRRELIATWGTGEGDLARRIAAGRPTTDTVALLRLAWALTELSVAAWHTYTHPASAVDSFGTVGEAWQREEERKALGELAQALAAPNVPKDGLMEVEYSPLLEWAHRAGRALLAMGDEELAEAVRGEVQVELAAVESAGGGDLSGRARQAVVLSREDASPVQVAAADRLLEQDPAGPDALFTEVDPTAAAVAATHWLYAAAQVAAEVSGRPLAAVMQEADDIEALPFETPTVAITPARKSMKLSSEQPPPIRYAAAQTSQR